MSKYKNRKVVAEGLTFASRREYNRYCELLLLEKAGEITELQTQVKFVLIPKQTESNTTGIRGGIKKGKTIERECSYLADFVYKDKAGKMIVEDTKGFRTKDYIIKRKLMLKVYGIRIREV